jgi:ABC-type transport system substrate-binding protein
MTIAIDRQAISNAVYSGTAIPIGVPLAAANMGKYQIPYDPAAAKQLLNEAGYPNGFSFRVISSINPNMPEAPRIMEALASYWQQTGLDPKITVIDYNAYTALRNQAKTAGDVALFKITVGSDMLDRCGLILIPGSPVPLFQDEWSYATWKEGNAKVNADERSEYVDKLNQYYYENYGPIPILNIGSNWAWNSATVSPWPHSSMNPPGYLEYVRHAQPLNTFRLFTPFQDR